MRVFQVQNLIHIVVSLELSFEEHISPKRFLTDDDNKKIHFKMWGIKVQSLLVFFLGLVALSQAIIDTYAPETKLDISEGENVDLMCRTNATKFSYCKFTHPNNVLWVKFKFDDASQTVKELKRRWLDGFEYTGPDSQTCQITLKNVIAGDEGESGKWKCKVEDWETEDQEEGE